MQAVVVPEFGDPSVMELRDVEPPQPGPEEVQINVESVGVVWTDIDHRRGNVPDALDDRDPPFVPGFEATGTVSETGEKVQGVSPGDEVVAFTDGGAYAEKVVTRSEWVLPKPDGLALREAAWILSNGFTAHNVVHEWGDLSADETVLVHAAAGGVGSMVVQMASAVGATVVGTASSEEKLSFASEQGADHVVNYETTDIEDAIGDVTTDGVDVVFDGVGGQAFYDSLDVLAAGGRVVAYGAASGSVPVVSTPRLYVSNATLIGYDLVHALHELPDRVFASRDALYEGIADGTFEMPITDVRPLSDAMAVHEEIASRETTGKVLLVP